MTEKKRPKVLYVDDEDANLFLFEMVFKDVYNVHKAMSAKEGLEELEENPDVNFIISDMKMPEKSGLEFVKEVKKKNGSVPCMILSGYSETEEIINALKEKLIIDYMIKPLDRDKIIELITRYSA